MDGIDSHHLVCAWLNISPVARSDRSSSNSSPPSSADTAESKHYSTNPEKVSHRNDTHPPLTSLCTVCPSHRAHILRSSTVTSFPLDGGLGNWGWAGSGDRALPSNSPLAVYPPSSHPISSSTPLPPPTTTPGAASDGTTPPGTLPPVSGLLSDKHIYSANLESVPARPTKRSRASHSWSANSALSTSTTTAPSPSETRAKRRALEILVPSTQFGTTVRPASFPEHVRKILRRFAPAELDQGCLPFTPEVECQLELSFSHEFFPSYARRGVSPTDNRDALAFFDFVTRIHNTCTRNHVKALDEASWHPCVRSLLSVGPPISPSTIPTLPPPDAHDPSTSELFLTIDATTKNTRKSILPNYSTIKLDHLLVFNPEHPLLHSTATTARTRPILINAFADSSIDDVLIALGIEVKAPGGTEGPIAAEFQLGVWSAKTLAVSSGLAPLSDQVLAAACDVAVGLSVCGHVWAMHVTYWSSLGAMVVHGPVTIGSTDTLFGTIKIVAWVVRFKEWARDVMLQDWIERVAGLC